MAINKTCLQCGTLFHTKENKGKFCSSSCAAKYSNTRRDFKPSTDNRLKTANCKKCNSEIEVNIRANVENCYCSDCKKDIDSNRRRKIKNNATKTVEIICKICKKPFYTNAYSTNKPAQCCSRDCRTIASTKIRPYQNGSRKITYYFNKWQGYEVLLESSWEVKVAQYLDAHEIEWIRPEPVKWIDKNNVDHLYYPDFFIPKLNLFVDPKNPYCMEKDIEKIQIVSKNLPLIVGNVDYIINVINNIIQQYDSCL